MRWLHVPLAAMATLAGCAPRIIDGESGSSGTSGGSGGTGSGSFGPSSVGTASGGAGTAGTDGTDTGWEPKFDVPAIDGCEGKTYAGYVFGQSPEDLTFLEGVKCLDGTLDVTGDAVAAAAALGIEVITGGLFLTSGTCAAGDGLVFSGLRRIDSGAYVQSIDCGSIEFPELVSLSTLDLLGAGATTVRFPALTQAGYLSVGGIPELETLDFGALVEGDGIFVWQLPRLKTLAGLDKLETVSDLWIAELGGLDSLSGLANLTAAGSVSISGCGGLTDLDGLQGLTDVGNLTLIQLSNLSSLGALSGLGAIDGALELRAMGSLQSLAGLEAVEWVSGALVIDSMTNLDDLTGLDLLGHVGRDFSVTGTGLTSLAGAPQLLLVGWGLTIENNPILASVADLTALQSVGRDLVIRNNITLPTADAQTFAASLTVGGQTIIEGNG